MIAVKGIAAVTSLLLFLLVDPLLIFRIVVSISSVVPIGIPGRPGVIVSSPVIVVVSVVSATPSPVAVHSPRLAPIVPRAGSRIPSIISQTFDVRLGQVVIAISSVVVSAAVITVVVIVTVASVAASAAPWWLPYVAGDLQRGDDAVETHVHVLLRLEIHGAANPSRHVYRFIGCPREASSTSTKAKAKVCFSFSCEKGKSMYVFGK